MESLPEHTGPIATAVGVATVVLGWLGWARIKPSRQRDIPREHIYTVKLAEADHDLLRDLKTHMVQHSEDSKEIVAKLDAIRIKQGP